jgi:hypothetical protein
MLNKVGEIVKNSSVSYLLIYGWIRFLYSGGNGHSLRVLILIGCVMLHSNGHVSLCCTCVS